MKSCTASRYVPLSSMPSTRKTARRISIVWSSRCACCEYLRLMNLNTTLSPAPRSHSHQIDAGPDVATLVEKFKSVIGTTWAQVTRVNNTSHVTKGPRRGGVPWREVAAVMRRTGRDAPDAYIRRSVSALTPYFEWLRE